MSEGPIAGRYVLSRRLGQGGMGVVWRARDELLEREVAIKEVRLPAAESDPDHRRTMREARAAAQLRHPGIVTVYDVVLHEDRPWIVMELLGGPSLAQVLDNDGPLPPHRVAAIALQLVEALETAHRKGILHRDVKPANVLLDGDRAVLTDFGIATMPDATALTASGMLVGSPEYTAPERIDGTQAGTAADLWALGVTLYTAVAGRTPFRRDGTAATLAAVLSSDPDPLPDAGALWPAITGLLHKDPAHRLTTDQVRPLLDKAIAPAPELPTSPGTPNPAPTAVEDPRAMDTVSPDTLPRTRIAPPDLPPIQEVPPKPPDLPSHQVPPLAQSPRQHAYPGPPYRYPPGRTTVPKGPILTTAGALLLAIVVVAVWFLWPDRSSRAGTGTSTSTTPSAGTTTESAPATATTRPPPGPPVPPAPAPSGYTSRQEYHLGYSLVLPNGYRVDDRDVKPLEMTYQFAPAGQPEMFCRVSVFKPDRPPNPTGFLHGEFFSKLKDEFDDNANNSVFWHDERKLPNPGQWAASAAQMNYTGQDFSRSPASHFWGMVRVVVSRTGFVYAVEIRFHSETEKGVADAFKRDRPAIIGVLDSFRVHL